MYQTIKKLGLGFIVFNIFMFQSLMADMMFYYSAAILPSIIASKQQSHPAVGAWSFKGDDGDDPLLINLVILNNGEYYGAQGRSDAEDEESVAGGLVVGTFTLDGNDLTINVGYIIHTNAGDAISAGTRLTYSPVNDTLNAMNGEEIGLVMTRNKVEDAAWVGAWVVTHPDANDGIEAMLTLDANGTYMVSNIDLFNYGAAPEEGDTAEDGLANMFEMGTYSVEPVAGTTYIDITFTIEPARDFNGNYGFNDDDDGQPLVETMRIDTATYPNAIVLDANNDITAATLRRVQRDNIFIPKDKEENTLIGAWAVGETNVPYAALLVVLDDKNYFMTQQALGVKGIIGGVEAGTYTLSYGAFTQAVPTVNSNEGDTATCGVMQDNNDGTALYIELDSGGCNEGSDESIVTKIVSSTDYPEAGAWIGDFSHMFGGNADMTILVMDGNGTYMVSDIDYSEPGKSVDGDVANNMTEFGTYAINDTNITLIADAETDFSATCTEEDSSGCDTVAGDSNMEAGFNTGGTFGFSIDNNILTISFTEDGTLYELDFSKVDQ